MAKKASVQPDYANKVFFGDARDMRELPDNSIGLVVTSPPYFNIKDYSLDGRQELSHAKSHEKQIGDIKDFDNFIDELLLVWQECIRVLKPNGKLVINVPLMPMLKAEFNTHENRHIFDLNSAIPNFSRLYWMQKNDPKMTEAEKIEAAKVRLARSLAEKHRYFKEHGVSKEKGFELHHVVALAWAESEHHFKLLDNWKNMVYIDGYNHAKITQNRNLNVQMSVMDSGITLEDYSNNRIDFFFKKNIIWDPSKASIIQSYNKQLLDFVTVK